MELIDAGNDEYIIRQSTTLKTFEVKFKPGVEFETDNPLEGKSKSKIVFENPNKLVQTNMEGPVSQVVREFTETEMIMVCVCFWWLIFWLLILDLYLIRPSPVTPLKQRDGSKRYKMDWERYHSVIANGFRIKCQTIFLSTFGYE